MDILGALLGNRCFKRYRAVVGRVVVAHEQPRFGWQAQQFANRGVQRLGVAARKVTARRTHVGHEQRVAHKHGIADLIRHASWRVARHGHHAGSQITDSEHLPVLQQDIELRAVHTEFGLEIEDALEHFLHPGDLVADTDLSSELLPQVGRRTQVVGMCMGLQDPLYLQALRHHVVDHLVRRGGAGAAGLGVVIQHRVNNRRSRAQAAMNNIGHCPCGRVKDAVYMGLKREVGHASLL